MARGPKKHMKRIRAPKSWMMNKLGGVFTVRPSEGPHRLRESMPLTVVLRDKLQLARTGREVDVILNQKEGQVFIDGKSRRNPKYPVGLMDVVNLPKTGAAYRVLYDVKGRFDLVRLSKKESQFKLVRIQKKAVGANNTTYLVTHDGRTIRYADKNIKIFDSVKLNVETGELGERFSMQVGNLAYVYNGTNRGRVGMIDHITPFPGNFDLVSLKDSKGNTFTTRINYVFVIGNGNKSSITLPRDQGVKLHIIEEFERRQENL